MAREAGAAKERDGTRAGTGRAGLKEQREEEEGERFLVDAIFSAHSDGLMVILRRASWGAYDLLIFFHILFLYALLLSLSLIIVSVLVLLLLSTALLLPSICCRYGPVISPAACACCNPSLLSPS